MPVHYALPVRRPKRACLADLSAEASAKAEARSASRACRAEARSASRACRAEARSAKAGFTLVELLIVVAIVGLLASIGLAVYRQARVSGSEASAIASLKAINDAQVAFSQTCGNQRFAPTLSSLGTPLPSTGQGFLSPDLTIADTVLKSGYQVTMAGTPSTEPLRACTGVAPVAAYQATADPSRPGVTGFRFFGTNTEGVIFADSATYTGNMPETGAPGHGGEIK